MRYQCTHEVEVSSRLKSRCVVVSRGYLGGSSSGGIVVIVVVDIVVVVVVAATVVVV